MFSQILYISTGLVLFLYGLVKLGTEIQKVFSVRIRQYIKYLVKKPLSGIGIGAIITALFQSSSASTVLFVGMVNAGLISFFNSLGLILGADIGTTLTVQLTALKFTAISPLFIAIGIIFWFFSKDKLKMVGEAIFYFGLLFFGLSLMNNGLGIFKESLVLMSLLKNANNVLFGVIVGLVFTSIIQSSAATVGIMVLLAQQGLVTIESAFAIALGANIGTTVTALIASIGTSKTAKRAAYSHSLFKILGVLIILPFFHPFVSFLKLTTTNVAQQIATGHFLFGVLIVIVFVFLLKPFARLMEKLFPSKEEILPLWPEWLDKRFLYNAEKSFGAVAKELDREIMLAERNYYQAIKLISGFNKATKRSIFYIDLIIDNLQKEIMHYLDRVSCLQLSKEDTKKLFCYSSIVDDIERIGDHATNLVHLAEYKNMWKVSFSSEAESEIETIQNLVGENIRDARVLIINGSRARIKIVTERENKIDELVRIAKEHHLDRFYKGICLAMAGPIYNDMLVNFERISDHCQNIADYAEQMLK